MNLILKRILILACGGLALLLGILWANARINAELKFTALELLPQPVALHKVDLLNQQGQPVTSSNFNGHWSLVYFGFTSCPDLCPMELQQMAKVYHQLNIREQQLVELVFVSVDPERDSPAKMLAYVSFFEPKFIGLSGTNRQLGSFAKNFALYYQRAYIADGELMKVPAGFDMPKNAPEDYQVEHSSRIYLVNRQGEFMGSFAPPHNIDNILVDLRQLLKK